MGGGGGGGGGRGGGGERVQGVWGGGGGATQWFLSRMMFFRMAAKFLVLLHLVDHSDGNWLSARRLPYTAVQCRSPDCRTLQVSRQPYTAGLQTAVHCRWSRLPYTAGHADCRTLPVMQTAVHCRSCRLPYTAGTLMQTAVHCRSCRLPYTAGHADCRTLQVVQAARQPPHLTQSPPDTCGPGRPQSDGVELPLLQCCFTSTQRHYTTHGPIQVHDATSTSGRKGSYGLSGAESRLARGWSVVDRSANARALKPVLNWANVCSPNIRRTHRRTMICFLIELLVRRIGSDSSKNLLVLSWLVMRCMLRPELAADAQQTA